jgi:hypothetical protein
MQLAALSLSWLPSSRNGNCPQRECTRYSAVVIARIPLNEVIVDGSPGQPSHQSPWEKPVSGRGSRPTPSIHERLKHGCGP